MFTAQILNVIVAILMVAVIALQAEIMRRQNKILEIDKLPMLIFQKAISIQDVETKNIYINLNSTENKEEAFRVANVNYAFEIFNLSKYPVRVEYVDFIPSREHNEGVAPQQILRGIFGVKGIIIPPNQKRKIPDKMDANLKVPGVLRIKASNLYYPKLTLVYEYDLSSDKINKIEGLP